MVNDKFSVNLKNLRNEKEITKKACRYTASQSKNNRTSGK